MLNEEELAAKTKTVKAPTKKTDEMEVLFETTKSFEIMGETLVIRPFSFGELPTVIALLKGVGSSFAYYQQNGSLNSVEAMMDLIAAGGENLIQALALNTKKPREFFDRISPEDGVKIMMEFLMMNIGFFTTRVVPLLQGIQSPKTTRTA